MSELASKQPAEPSGQLTCNLDLFPEQLQPRVVGLRKRLNKIRDKTPVAEQITLAAYAGDHAAAVACLDRAAELIDAERAASGLTPAALLAERDIAARAGATQVTERILPEQGAERNPLVVIRRGLTGNTRIRLPGAPVIASDGSYNGRHIGWGYISSVGQWGCGVVGRPLPSRHAPDVPHAAVIAELHAIGYAAASCPGPVIVVADSTMALGYTAAWLAGDTRRMPPIEPGAVAYSYRQGAEHRRAILAEIAGQLHARRGELTLAHVKGLAGNLLNEAADALARMARRWADDGCDNSPEWMAAHAGDLAAAFLRQAAHSGA